MESAQRERERHETVITEVQIDGQRIAVRVPVSSETLRSILSEPIAEVLPLEALEGWPP